MQANAKLYPERTEQAAGDAQLHVESFLEAAQEEEPFAGTAGQCAQLPEVVQAEIRQ
jgi:hypothetical protein